MKETTWWQRYGGEDHLMASHNWRYSKGREANPIDSSLLSAFAKMSATRVDRYSIHKCICKRDIISPYPTHPALSYTPATYTKWKARKLTFYYQTRESKSHAPFSTIPRHAPVFIPPSLPGHVERGKVEEAVWAAWW